MTVIICSIVYIYCILSVQYYRKEIKIRIASGYSPPKRYKAPFTIKKTVLLCALPTIINLLIFCVSCAEFLILINTVPIIVLSFILYQYRKKIIKMDNEE